MSWGAMVQPDRVMVPGEGVFWGKRGGRSLTATVPGVTGLLAVSFEDIANEETSSEESVCEDYQTIDAMPLEDCYPWDSGGEDVWRELAGIVEISM